MRRPDDPALSAPTHSPIWSVVGSYVMISLTLILGGGLRMPRRCPVQGALDDDEKGRGQATHLSGPTEVADPDGAEAQHEDEAKVVPRKARRAASA